MSADTKQKILDATIELLYDKVSTEVRTRDIASRAGVNIATLHYYYGSKEALVATAVETITTQGLDAWVTAHLDRDRVEKSHLMDYLRFLFTNTLQYQSLAKTRLLAMVASDEVNPLQMRIYDTLHRLLEGLRPDLPDGQLRLKANMLYATAMNLSCSPRETTAFLQVDLEDPEALEAYVRELVADVL
jgi:AcrR family transcriptional regulator